MRHPLKCLKTAQALMKDDKFRITRSFVLREQNRAADFMALIAKTKRENEKERNWTKKVPKGLNQILIKDWPITKVNFMPEIQDSTIHIESPEFMLMPKRQNWEPHTDSEMEAKVVSKWFEGLVYCPLPT